MKMDIKNKWPIAALSLIGLASTVSAAKNDDRCAPQQPNCYPDDCTRCYCLGPDNYGANAPVCPKTCNGDFWIEVCGFYWNAHQDGMEYALKNNIYPGSPVGDQGFLEVNNLIDAKYLHPDFNWDFGFKAGIGYCHPCDGWDIGINWTWFKGSGDSHVDIDETDANVIVPLWSAFASTFGGPLWAGAASAFWKLELNLVDIELGREYWVSKYLTMRPFVGVRIGWIYQDYDIEYKGGTWRPTTPDVENPIYNDKIKLDNDYRGAGLRGGLDTVWHLGCGWGLYGDFALNILYGKFSFDHDETNRGAGRVDGNVNPNEHRKAKVADASYSFRASRAIFDLAFGLQWAGMFCDCKYGLMVSLGWEHHLFMDQNQFWRVVRIGDTAFTNTASTPSNNTGENTFHQRRGDLDTQGWTLCVKFDF